MPVPPGDPIEDFRCLVLGVRLQDSVYGIGGEEHVQFFVDHHGRSLIAYPEALYRQHGEPSVGRGPAEAYPQPV